MIKWSWKKEIVGLHIWMQRIHVSFNSQRNHLFLGFAWFPDYGFPDCQILDFQCWNLVFFITTSEMHFPRPNKTISTVIDEKLPNWSQTEFSSKIWPLEVWLKIPNSKILELRRNGPKYILFHTLCQCRKLSWTTKSLFNSQISPIRISNQSEFKSGLFNLMSTCNKFDTSLCKAL